MKKTFAIAAAALAALANPALAGEVPQAQIDIADLDLSTAADQQRLDRRIDSTARRICDSGSLTIAARKLEKACRDAVGANAAPKVELAIAQARGERFATIDLDVQG